MMALTVSASHSVFPGLKPGTGAILLTAARPSISSSRMYIQPMSNSYQALESFADDQDAPGDNIGAGVLDRIVAIAPVVPNAVDHARGPERYPDHLDCEDQTPWTDPECD